MLQVLHGVSFTINIWQKYYSQTGVSTPVESVPVVLLLSTPFYKSRRLGFITFPSPYSNIKLKENNFRGTRQFSFSHGNCQPYKIWYKGEKNTYFKTYNIYLNSRFIYFLEIFVIRGFLCQCYLSHPNIIFSRIFMPTLFILSNYYVCW